MAEVVGSIDNAFISRNAYHLFFTKESNAEFLLVTGKEMRKDIWGTQMSNLARMMPVYGEVSNYNVAQNEVMEIFMANEAKGKEIEDNLDKYLSEQPPQFEALEYSSVDSVKLSSGSAFSLPFLVLASNNKKT
ncbi:hypothetical protein B1B_00760, partial [mine drainage metagenome]